MFSAVGAEIEKVNRIPVTVITAKSFVQMGTATVRGLGLPDLPYVSLPEEMYVEKIKEVRPSVEAAMDDIVDGLTQWKPPEVKPQKPEMLVYKGKDYADALDRMNTSFLSRFMSDGFPLLPPTKEKVEWMLSGTDLPPDEVIGCYADLYRPVTVMNVAINAVMAGARPEHLPVIIGAFKAINRSQAQHPMFGSTSAYAPMTIVNGPIAKALNINSGVGLMGPGWQANACIGRAISLVFTNGVGQVPGTESPSIQAIPNRYSWCFAENEDLNPWQPLHVDRGYARDASAVTLWCGTGSRLFRTILREPGQILSQISFLIESEVVAPHAPPWDRVLILSPSDAETLADGGWTKHDIGRYVYENARLPAWKVGAAGGAMLFHQEKWETVNNENAMVPSLRGPEYLVIVVGGARGSHKSQWVSCVETGTTEGIDQYKPKNWDALLREAERSRREVENHK